MSSTFEHVPLTVSSQGRPRDLTLYFSAIIAVVVQSAVLFWVIVPYLEHAGHGLYSFGFVDDYDKLGFNIAYGNGYRFFTDAGLTLMREPGYPLFLAAAFKLFGYGLQAARIANVGLLVVASCTLIALAQRVSTKRWVPLVAVALFLLHPGVIVAEMRGGVEIIFIAFLLLFVLAMYRAIDSGKVRAYLIAGAVLGLTTSVRSTALLYPLMLPFLLFFMNKQSLSVRYIVPRLALLYLAVAVVLAPWTIRNYRLVGAIIPTASVQGVAAHAGQYICEHMDAQHGFLELDLQSAWVRRYMAQDLGYRFHWGYYLYFLDPRDEVSFNKVLMNSVVSKYKANPALFARCAAENVFNFWFAGKTWRSTWLNVAVQTPYLLLAALGIWGSIKQRRFNHIAILVGLVAYLFCLHVPIHSQARYSVPLVPFLAVLAAMFLARIEWWKLLRGKRPEKIAHGSSPALHCVRAARFSKTPKVHGEITLANLLVSPIAKQ